VEYGVALYDAQSVVTPTTSATVLEWSSDSTGFGVFIYEREVTRF
jgi:hypothetical protein